MNPDRFIRCALAATVPADYLAAAVLLFPQQGLGQWLGLPSPAPDAMYRALLALMIALFGAAYLW